MNVQCICTILAALLKFDAFISEAFGAKMYLLEPKGGVSGRSLGLFYCLIFYGPSSCSLYLHMGVFGGGVGGGYLMAQPVLRL